MDIDIRDIITLDDINRYLVASKTFYEGKKYYYLVNLNNSKDILFCYEDEDDLIELYDNELIQKLVPLFYQETHNILKEVA